MKISVKQVVPICGFLALLVTASNLPAQTEARLFHYPLDVGDFWEYSYAPAFRQTVAIVGDTLMPNGQHYRAVKQEVHGHASFTFQRIAGDSALLQFNEFENLEHLMFKLRIKAGDTWRMPCAAADSGFFRVTHLADTTLFGRDFTYAIIRDFVLPDSTRPIAPNDYFIADSLGIIFHQFEGGFRRLNGAVIAGKLIGVVASVTVAESVLPQDILLKQNYPNPFNAGTRIDYEIRESGFVTLTVYNASGQDVRVLVEQQRSPGHYSTVWDGKDNRGKRVASGIYIYMLAHRGRGGLVNFARKLLLLR